MGATGLAYDRYGRGTDRFPQLDMLAVSSENCGTAAQGSSETRQRYTTLWRRETLGERTTRSQVRLGVLRKNFGFSQFDILTLSLRIGENAAR